MKKHIGILQYLRDLNEKERKIFLKGASSELLKIFGEICLNLLAGKIKITPKHLKKLKKYKKEIIILAEKRYSTKKRLITSQKGGFIGAILGTLLPIIVSAIITATAKKE